MPHHRWHEKMNKLPFNYNLQIYFKRIKKAKKRQINYIMPLIFNISNLYDSLYIYHNYIM